MSAVNAYYLEFATKASELEREKQWREASSQWQFAMKSANTNLKRDWATSRAQFCAKRAGLSHQIINM